MKVLIVCSGNTKNLDSQKSQPFIYEQVDSIEANYDVQFDFFFIHGKGALGYLKNYLPLLKKIRSSKFDIIHAHYGMSGLLASLQRAVPVIVTFHGSDINVQKNRFYSLCARILAKKSIYVSKEMTQKIRLTSKDCIIPCGINLTKFFPIDKFIARQKLGLKPNMKYILFSSSFENSIKNPSFAKKIASSLSNENELLELYGRERDEVNLLLNAADMLLLTSYNEGSPQIIKEALACNCPIVASDVGDIRKRVSGVTNCFVLDLDYEKFCKACDEILSNPFRTNGRERVSTLSNNAIAKEIFNIYVEIIKKYGYNS